MSTLSNRYRSDTAVALASATAYVMTSLVVDGRLEIGREVVLQPSSGLAVPVGIAFGLPAALGIGLAVLGVNLSTLSLAVGCSAVSHVALALLASELWDRGILPTDPGKTWESADVWVGILSVTALSSIVAAALLAWGYEILGLFPFYVSFPAALLDFLLGTVVVGFPALYVLRRLGGWPGVSETPASADGRRFCLSLSAAVLWGVGGVVGSVGFAIREKLPSDEFVDRGLGVLYEVVHPDVFGHGGRRAQVVFGGLMLTLVVGHLLVHRGGDGWWN